MSLRWLIPDLCQAAYVIKVAASATTSWFNWSGGHIWNIICNIQIALQASNKFWSSSYGDNPLCYPCVRCKSLWKLQSRQWIYIHTNNIVDKYWYLCFCNFYPVNRMQPNCYTQVITILLWHSAHLWSKLNHKFDALICVAWNSPIFSARYIMMLQFNQVYS